MHISMVWRQAWWITGRGIEGLLALRGAMMEESAGTSPEGWPGLCGQRPGEPCWKGA